MKRHTALAAIAAASALALTGCAPGWEGTGTVIELEYMEPSRTGGDVEHDGLEITVLTPNGRESSVLVEDCPDGQVIMGDKVTVQDVTSRCGELNHSTDD